jgi:hypothetical protein
MEWFAETVGAGSLLLLFYLLREDLAKLAPTTSLAAALLAEGGFLLGLLLSPRCRTVRLTLAFGTACRNIGLSLFIAAGLFHDNRILGPLFAESLSVLALGLLHVGLARVFLSRSDSTSRA